MPKRQLVLVVSAPSGAGKTTLCDRLLQEFPELTYSISATTRPPRGMEEDGEDYFFLSEDEFRRRMERNDFLEHALVHGYRYGTPREAVYEALAEGQSVLMDIDVAGAARLRRIASELPPDDPVRCGFVDVFVLPPSLEALRERLEDRGEDSDEVIARRLYNARAEMQDAPLFKYRITNDNLEHAYRELCGIFDLESERVVARGGKP